MNQVFTRQEETEYQIFRDIWQNVIKIYKLDYDEKTIKFTWDLINYIEIIDIIEGIKSHLRHPEEGRYPPKPCDLIRHAKKCEQKRLAQQKIEEQEARQKAALENLPSLLDAENKLSSINQQLKSEPTVDLIRQHESVSSLIKKIKINQIDQDLQG